MRMEYNRSWDAAKDSTGREREDFEAHIKKLQDQLAAANKGIEDLKARLEPPPTSDLGTTTGSHKPSPSVGQSMSTDDMPNHLPAGHGPKFGYHLGAGPHCCGEYCGRGEFQQRGWGGGLLDTSGRPNRGPLAMTSLRNSDVLKVVNSLPR